MNDKNQILKQIGWSDELIDRCLYPDNKPVLELPEMEYNVLVASEQDVTNFVVSTDDPTIVDGTCLNL